MKNKSFISNCMDISTNECNSNWLVIICHFKSIKSYKNVPSKICFKILFWGPRTSVISILVMHVLPVAWDINLQSSNHCMAVHYSPLAMWLTHKQSKWLERVFFFFFASSRWQHAQTPCPLSTCLRFTWLVLWRAFMTPLFCSSKKI